MYRAFVLAAVAAMLGALVGDARSGAPRTDLEPEQIICRSSALPPAR